MQIVLALVGALVGAMLDEWRGAFLGGALGYALGELWLLKQRVADLERSVRESKSERLPDTAAPTIRETLVAARAEMPPAKPVAPSPAALAPAPRPQAAIAEGARRAMPPATRMTTAEEFPPFRWVREFFTGGNTVVRVSVAILFVGIVLLLQYASEHGHLPIEARLTGGAIFALGLLVLGWRLRKKRPGYAVATQGGATGILYLIVFFAMRTYALLPASLAFALLLSIVVLSAALAVLQDAMWLALIGISGGFLAPILTSTGHGSHVALFTFYAILNVGLISIAWFKAWRPLNVIGFAFTFVIGIVWGVQQYSAALFASTEPFLVLFFAMYVAIAILFASRQAPNLKGYVDGTIVFGVPIAAFAIQSAMLYDRRYWLAVSAVIVSAFYLTLATALWRRRSNWRLLAESFVALSVAFATLAIPLALNGRWSAASWALEGAALIWVGCRQSRLLPRLAGLALQFAAAAHFLRDSDVLFTGLPVLNSTCLGALILAGASLFSTTLLQSHADRVTAFERVFSNVLFFWSLLWWLIAGIGEIDRRIVPMYEAHTLLAFFGITSLLCSEVQRRLNISVARAPALLLLPLMVFFAISEWATATQPFDRYGWLSWPLVWVVFYLTLHRHEDTEKKVGVILHVAAAWLMALLLSREIASLIDRVVNGGGSWPAIAWALVPATLLIAIPSLTRRLAWPLAKHEYGYAVVACGGFAVYLFVWSLFTSVARSGDPYPLPYVPIFNPLDIAQMYALLAGLLWFRRVSLVRSAIPSTARWSAFAVIGFVWLNAILLRTIHYWADVLYIPQVLWRSPLVQTSLSIFWTSLALGSMLYATRRGSRPIWIVGIALMSTVVAKLLMVDLSRIGSFARIVSFLGVGLLMLVIGYFAPLPPQSKEQPQ